MPFMGEPRQQNKYPGSLAQRNREGPIFRARPRFVSHLAAAIMVALRCSRGLAQVVLGIKVELLLARGAAEVIGLPLVLGSFGGPIRF